LFAGGLALGVGWSLQNEKSGINQLIKPSELASCSGGAKFSVGRDRNLTVVLDLVEAGMPALEVKYPGF